MIPVHFSYHNSSVRFLTIYQFVSFNVIFIQTFLPGYFLRCKIIGEKQAGPRLITGPYVCNKILVTT